MKPIVCASIILACLCAAAHSTMWVDPTFEEMVERAELIAVVEVAEGGDFYCRVKATDVLKGKAPAGPFHVGGYNNPMWPQRARKKEAYAKGGKVLMLLHKGQVCTVGRVQEHRDRLAKGVQAERELLAELKRKPKADESALKRLRAHIQALEKDIAEMPQEVRPRGPRLPATTKMWRVPTPSTGDYRIKKGKLHGGWYLVSYPDRDPGVDAAMVIELVRGYVQHKAGRPPHAARKVLAEKLTVKAVQDISKAKAPENLARAQEVHWLLCAQGAYGVKERAAAVLSATRCRDSLVQICAARAIRSLGASKEPLAALAELLMVPHPYVQAEACRTLIAGGFAKGQAAPLLLKALPKSDPRGQGPRSIMDPIRNVYASGREMMIRALTHFGADREAHDLLLKFLPSKALSRGIFSALSTHFVKYPSVQARTKFLKLYRVCPEDAMPLFHEYLLAEKSRESLKAVSGKLLGVKTSDYQHVQELKKFFAVLKRDDPLLVATATKGAGKFANEDWIVPVCVKALVREGSDASIKLAADSILNANIGMLYRSEAIDHFVRGLPRDHPAIRSVVLEALRKHGSAKDSHWILPFSMPAASEEIRKLLPTLKISYKSDGKERGAELLRLVREAVDLKLDPPKDDRKRVAAWLDVLRRSLNLGSGAHYPLAELLRSTPPGLRSEVAEQLRALPKELKYNHITDAIRLLEGKPVEKNKGNTSAVRNPRSSPPGLSRWNADSPLTAGRSVPSLLPAPFPPSAKGGRREGRGEGARSSRTAVVASHGTTGASPVGARHVADS